MPMLRYGDWLVVLVTQKNYIWERNLVKRKKTIQINNIRKIKNTSKAKLQQKNNVSKVKFCLIKI